MPKDLTKRGRFWHYQFWIGGHCYRGTTRCEDLATAKLVLAEIRRDTVLGAHGLDKAPTLLAAAEAWMEAKRKLSASHLRIAKQALADFQDLHSLPLDRITDHRLEEWRNRYMDTHSPASANNRLRYLKAWCRWAIKRVPFTLKPVKFQQKARPILKAGQVLAFLRAVNQGNRDGRQARCAIRIMLATGMRESEILGMRWDWLDTERGVYEVHKAKSKRARLIPVPEWALEPLLILPRTVSGLVFPAEDGKPHRQGWLRQAFERAGREAGLPKLSNHRLRASFATIQSVMGTELKEIQAILGHASITTTMVYIETDMDRKKAAQERMARGMGLA